MIKSLKRHNTREVVAVTCAIFREANNSIVRAGTKSSSTRLIQHYAGAEQVTVTPADTEMADTVITYVQQRTTMDALTGAKVALFVKNVMSLLEEDTVGDRNFGTIVWLPKLYSDMVARDETRMELAHFAVTSKYVGKIKDKVEINFAPLTVNYHREYNCFRHLGHDGNGNLIGFLHKTQLSGTIRGRVKKQEVSRYHSNARVTYLNYVQEVK